MNIPELIVLTGDKSANDNQAERSRRYAREVNKVYHLYYGNPYTQRKQEPDIYMGTIFGKIWSAVDKGLAAVDKAVLQPVYKNPVVANIAAGALVAICPPVGAVAEVALQSKAIADATGVSKAWGDLYTQKILPTVTATKTPAQQAAAAAAAQAAAAKAAATKVTPTVTTVQPTKTNTLGLSALAAGAGLLFLL